ncbi:MAG TPA: sulfate ABC transporter ATP-binding protein, partial [Planctomycetaceae bacterium]|nr:sulfate ABC transporter ATP-binding protein [Planctomycetaceae bacterium]
RPILRDVNLTLAEAETLVVLGSSGCGKSTLLKCLAGLLRPAAGTVAVSGSVAGPISLYLDQEPLLFEHLNVFENAAFALRLRRTAEAEVRREVGQLLELTGLESEVRKSVWQLSGGQKQRLAFVRALLARPRLLLMDEPFASLDAQTRLNMQAIFCSLAEQHQMTTVFVTHDVREALTLGTVFGRLVGGGYRDYGCRAEFIADPETGVREELDFWDGIRGAD